MKLKPIQDLVLIKLDPFEKTFESDYTGSIIERPQIANEKPRVGTVIGVGDGKTYKKGYRPTSVNNGDRVIIDWSTGHDMQNGNRLYVWAPESDILGVIDD